MNNTRHCDYCDNPITYVVQNFNGLIETDSHVCYNGYKAASMAVPAVNFYAHTHEAFECPYDEDLPLEIP